MVQQSRSAAEALTAPLVEQARGSGGGRAIAAYVWAGLAAKRGRQTIHTRTKTTIHLATEACHGASASHKMCHANRLPARGTPGKNTFPDRLRLSSTGVYSLRRRNNRAPAHRASSPPPWRIHSSTLALKYELFQNRGVFRISRP